MDCKSMLSGASGQDDAVRLEIPAHVLMRLLAEGHLGAADLRCLDCTSRACLRRLCLRSCVRPSRVQSVGEAWTILSDDSARYQDHSSPVST
jgi:hypothetical protein